MGFMPVMRTTRNILQTLRDFSLERKISLTLLEFEILAYETFILRQGSQTYERLDRDQILCEDELLDSLLLIIQEYSIRIVPKEKYEMISNINISLAADKFKTKAVVTIAQGSVFVEHKWIMKEIRDAIWKKKALAGLLIDFFEQNLDEHIKKLVTVIPLDKPTSKDIKFTVATAIPVKPPLDGRLVRVYETTQKVNTLIEGVAREELILKYIKPQSGRDGRGCNGKFIKVRQPKELDPQPMIDSSIYLEENENEINYFTAIDGYVVFESGIFSISKKLVLESADFKSTGMIDTGEDKEISVHIGGNRNIIDDAISHGVKINTRELNVDGGIGSNVNIIATELSITEQTHKRSKIDVSNVANIRLHKGDLTANEANIGILEMGKVKARKSINIGQMLGGEAVAPIVRVTEVLSNGVIRASERIEIQNIKGSGIKLIIDPKNIEGHYKKIEELKESITLISLRIKSGKELLAKEAKQHLLEVDEMKKLHTKVIHAQKVGQELIKQDMIRLKKYKKRSDDLKNREMTIEEEIVELGKLKDRLESLYEQDLHASIIHYGEYDGHTQVVFVNPKTEEKVATLPVGKQELITLAMGDNGREIRFV